MNSNLNNPHLLPTLNFPQYKFRIRKRKLLAGESFLNAEPAGAGEIYEIFDSVRKKFVVLNPEEWVRQHLLEFLVKEKKFPSSLLAVEKQLVLNNTRRRTDVVAYSNTMNAILIAECKAPAVKLDVDTLEQALRYNLVHKVSYLVITNGIQHFFFYRRDETGPWQEANEFPNYPHLLKT